MDNFAERIADFLPFMLDCVVGVLLGIVLAALIVFI